MTIKPRSKKVKGNKLEEFVADLIVNKGLDDRARRDGSSGAGNREKADICTSIQIVGRNAGIECKNHKNLHIPEWWRQARELEKIGREPVLVFKLPNGRYDEVLACIKIDTLLDLIKFQKEADDVENIIAGTNYEKSELYRSIEYFLPKLKKIKSLLDPRK